MSTLIVPDIHENLAQLLKLEPLIAKASHVIYMGDWFDTFQQMKHVEQMCQYILDHIDDERTTFLLGNHDCHYAFNHGSFLCSGYNHTTKAIVRHMIPPDVWRKFHLYTRVGLYLVSHAGFHEHTLQYARPEVEREAIETALAGGFDAIFSAGYARGGRVPIGGPTWLDWNNEFQPIDGIPQIVGHTQGPGVKVKSDSQLVKSYCIDTSLRHVAWWDGSVRIEMVDK